MSISWVITKDTATGTMRFQTTGSTLDLSQVIPGDYANIFGSIFNAANRGSWTITNVEYYYVGSVLTQAFEFLNDDGVAESVVQLLNDDLQFFRPTVNGISASNGRTVVVSSTEEGVVEVVVPATTDAVEREEKTGSYLHSNSEFDIVQLKREKDGTVKAIYVGSPNPTLSVDGSILLDGFQPSPWKSFVSKGDVGTYPATGTTDASSIDNASLLQVPTGGAGDVGKANSSHIVAPNGDVLIINGSRLNSGTYTSAGTISRFRPVSSALVTDATLADGATRYTYEWLAENNPGLNDGDHGAATLITAGPNINKIMILGGISSALSTYGSVTSGSTTPVIYNVSANTASSDGTLEKSAGMGLVTLADGRIVSFGGCETFTGFLAPLTQRTKTSCYIWNPGTSVWPGSASFNLLEARAFFTSTLLPSGKVLIAGGKTLAIAPVNDTNTLAHWPMNETAGTTIADSTTTYPLTASGGAVIVQGSKIYAGREFTGNSAAGAGNAGAATALVGDWTVEWWSSGDSGTDLSGIGVGSIVAYGLAGSELLAGNTLMHCYFDGTNLKVRWENGAGVDVNVITVPITEYLTNYYNHYAVRKTMVSSLATVDVFVNSIKVQTVTGVANAAGGTSSQWYLARDPDGATGFTGVIDDVMVSKVARTDIEIANNFLNASGNIQPYAGEDRIRVGKLLNSCEIFDNIGNTTSFTGRMMLARTGHTATVLPNGKVLVTGGLAYDTTQYATKLIDPASDILLGPSAATTSCEIYDPTSGRWEKSASMGFDRYNHTAILLEARNEVIVFGGFSTNGDQRKTVEILDLKTMKWKQSVIELPAISIGSLLLNNGTIFSINADVESGTLQKDHMLTTFESEKVSDGGINGIFKITEVGSGYFKYVTPEHISQTSSYGKVDETAIATIITAARTANVTSVYFGIFGHSFQVGDYVYVNFNNTVTFGSGLKIITATNSNAISYAEVASNAPSQVVDGIVYKNYAGDTTGTPGAATSNGVVGPYVFNPIDGVGITSLESSIVLPSTDPNVAGLFKGQKYGVLPVANSTVFPDSEGYVVLGFGHAIQSMPIKYFGRFNNNGLIIDANYVFENDIPNGTDVTLLSQRAPYVPTELVGGFYATDSSAGRVAAIKTINDIVAAGITVNVTIVYPGDRGLGGAGLPDHGTTKLSDKVSIWAGDDVDGEVKKLKGS